MRDGWVQILLRVNFDLVEDIKKHLERTGLKEQTLLREAIRLGIAMIEDKPTI